MNTKVDMNMHWRIQFDKIRRLPAIWTFASYWLVSVVLIAIQSSIGSALGFALGSVILFLMVMATVLLTQPKKDCSFNGSTVDVRIDWLKLGWIFFAIIPTFLAGLVMFNLIEPVTIPIWSAIVKSAGEFGEKTLDPNWVGNAYFGVAHPVAYFAIPFIGLCSLELISRFSTKLNTKLEPEKATFMESIGFGPSHRSGRVLVLWCAIPVAMLLWKSPSLSGQTVARSVFSNSLQNGFFEEFLFRGCLQNCLMKVLNNSWGIVVASIVFGLWHVGANFHNFTQGESLQLAITMCVFQSTMGVAFGIIFWRTRNLLACSLFHVVTNVTAELVAQ